MVMILCTRDLFPSSGVVGSAPAPRQEADGNFGTGEMCWFAAVPAKPIRTVRCRRTAFVGSLGMAQSGVR
jgi:hypothetical protein